MRYPYWSGPNGQPSDWQEGWTIRVCFALVVAFLVLVN
jgi:hypothetical protein